jgi:2-polyprenyl-3-methyl-5-hydroxy-6-metoxy-1,4-benzoquinol methylase
MKFVLDTLMKQRNAQIKTYLIQAKKILELGCGSASLIKELNKNQQYVGVDLNTKLIKALKKRFPKHQFYNSNLEKTQLETKEKFDLILLVAFIEHLKNPDPLMKNSRKLLMAEGRIVMTTPTRVGDFLNTVGAYLGLTAMSAVKDHEIIYNKKKMKALAERNGLEIETFKHFQFGLNQLIVMRKK